MKYIFFKIHHVGEGEEQTNFHQKTADNCDNTHEHMGKFCLDLIVLSFITENNSLGPLLDGLLAKTHIDMS